MRTSVYEAALSFAPPKRRPAKASKVPAGMPPGMTQLPEDMPPASADVTVDARTVSMMNAKAKVKRKSVFDAIIKKGEPPKPKASRLPPLNL